MPLLHALKLGGGWVGGGLKHFSVSARPLGFGFRAKGFGAKGLGPGLDNYIKEYFTMFNLLRTTKI